jgi:hypothetical protein
MLNLGMSGSTGNVYERAEGAKLYEGRREGLDEDDCYAIGATRMCLEAVAAMVNFGRNDNHGFACSNKR